MHQMTVLEFVAKFRWLNCREHEEMFKAGKLVADSWNTSPVDVLCSIAEQPGILPMGELIGYLRERLRVIGMPSDVTCKKMLQEAEALIEKSAAKDEWMKLESRAGKLFEKLGNKTRMRHYDDESMRVSDSISCLVHFIRVAGELTNEKDPEIHWATCAWSLTNGQVRDTDRKMAAWLRENCSPNFEVED